MLWEHSSLGPKLRKQTEEQVIGYKHDGGQSNNGVASGGHPVAAVTATVPASQLCTPENPSVCWSGSALALTAAIF